MYYVMMLLREGGRVPLVCVSADYELGYALLGTLSYKVNGTVLLAIVCKGIGLLGRPFLQA